jgi:hypothetical protein
MLKKIVTTAGLVSVFGASAAFAVQNLSSATAVTPIYYASETLGTGTGVAGTGANAGTTFQTIANASNNIDVSLLTGFAGAVTSTADYFVRVDLTNAAYATAAEAMSVTSDGTGTSTKFSGGAVGTSSAIYQFDIANAASATTKLTTTFTNLATNGNPTVKMSIFETLTEAKKTDGAAVTSGSQIIAQFKAGNKATTTPANEVAEVATGFKKYKVTAATQDLLGQLGSTAFSLTTNTLAADDGALVAATDLYQAATSKITVNGDLSVGTWYLDTAGCPSKAAPLAANKLTLNAAKTSGTQTITKLTALPALCNVVAGTVEIPASAYTLDIDYVPAANTVGATDSVGVNLGVITQNGSTGLINYLTTFSGYNQRVYITNRGATDATYAFTFTSEAGTTATAGTAATGTAKANSVLVLKATDIVTLTGKTRTAAKLAIVGTPSSFKVSTQQVNISSGGTDTITVAVN